MKKQKWLGAVLNMMVPGLGFLYAGTFVRARIAYALTLLLVFLPRVVGYNFWLLVAALSVVLAWLLYLIVGGYRAVKTYTHTMEPKVFDRWYVYVLLIVLHATIANLAIKPLASLLPIQFASIPTPSMDPALQPGDYMAYERTSRIDRNDIVVFNVHEPEETMYVFRCTGLPGDTLVVNKGRVITNDRDTDVATLKSGYMVKVEGTRINPVQLDPLGIDQHDFYQLTPDSYLFNLTDSAANKMQSLGFVREVTPHERVKGEAERLMFIEDNKAGWNVDYFGPMYIPRAGEEIELNSHNASL